MTMTCFDRQAGHSHKPLAISQNYNKMKKLTSFLLLLLMVATQSAFAQDMKTYQFAERDT